MTEDASNYENELHSFSQKELVQIAKLFNIPDINESTDKPIIVRNILRGVGFKYTTHISKITVNKKSTPAPIVRPKVAEQYDMLRTYVGDEIMLLRAVASMLETLMLNGDMSLQRDNLEQVMQYAANLIGEITYYQRHSNLGRFSRILNELRPQPRIDEAT